MTTRRDERGQTVPLVLAVMVVAVVMVLALIPLARAAQQRAAAQTAADAAALAGAAEGEEVARQVAAANGGQLVRWEAVGLEVWVQVEVGEATARAKARRG
ncbi:MAG: pilus assembly protein TadG-related protein [Acidimicrobiales bacterium]